MKMPLTVNLDLSKCAGPGVYLHQGKWTVSGCQVEGLILDTSDGPINITNGTEIRGDNFVTLQINPSIKPIRQTIMVASC